jgi:glycosyltransferase involved in cell wall biosynthesis
LPLISVVIPVYNGERTIRCAVRSVLKQTFQDFELIVINDGSNDSTVEILSTIDDPRLRVFSFPNRGLSVSRNRGIALASGEYISFLDADDLWTTDKLEDQLNALRQKPKAAICYSFTDFIDEAGNRLGYGINSAKNGYVFPDLLAFYFVGSGSNALIRATALELTGQFDETLTAMEDWDLFLRLAADHHFVAVPKAHILYRVSDDSLSSNVLRVESEMLKVVERVYSQEPGKSFAQLKRLTLSNLYLFLASRTLKGLPNRQNGVLAARFMWRSFVNNPRVLRQLSYVSTLIFKMISATLLPTDIARAIRAVARSMVQRVSGRAAITQRR